MEYSTTTPRREIALLLTGASGMVLPVRLAEMLLEHGNLDALHLVVSEPACRVLTHELGSDWASGPRMRDRLISGRGDRPRIDVWADDDLVAPIASGSHPLMGTVVLPCSAGTAGAVAHGISRGLIQRAADVALKQRRPLILGIRETPMSEILLENLLRLARAGVVIAPPVPSFYLRPDSESAYGVFIDHYCLRVLDLLGIEIDRNDLRWERQ